MRIDSPLMTNVQATGSFSGSFSGSFEGDITADSVAFENITGKPILISGSTGTGGGTLGQVGSGTPYESQTSASSFTIQGDEAAGYSGILSLKKGANEEFLIYETSNIVALQASSSNNIWLIPNGNTSAAVKIDTAGSVIPSSATQDLGSAAAPWRDLYLSGNSLLLGGLAITQDGSGNLDVSDSTSGANVDLSVGGITIVGESGSVKLSVDSSGNLTTEDPANPGSATVGTYSGSFTGTGEFSSVILGGTAISATGTELNFVDGVTSAIQGQIDAKASIAQLDASSSALQSNIDAKASITQLNASSSALQSNIDAKASIVQLNASSSALQSNIDTNSTAITALQGTDIGITLTGDVTGTGTITNLGDVSFVTTVVDDSHNHIISNVDGLQAALDLKAPLASPTFTGTVTIPTPASGDNSTKAASTAYVNTKIQEVVSAAPAALDTLNELAAAIGDDANFAGTVTTSLGEKLAKASNLSDLTDASAARSNLGVDTKANTWTGVSGDVTISATGVATVADDSHNHVISNIDGLQTALDAKQAAGTYNTIIGTDTDIDTSGATIIDNLYMTDGVITSHGTRTLTLADLGYTGAANANYITNNNQLTNGAGYTTYSANQTLNNNSNVHFEGLMVGQTSGATANTIRCIGDVVAYYSSDIQFKDNVTQLEGALDKVKQIRGVEFDWNDKQDVHEGHDIGVIAQEVEAVYPELVHYREHSDSKAVDYVKLTAVLIEAVKELSAKVEKLENK